MANKSLRKRIGFYVLIPLLVGIIIISLVSSIPLYTEAPLLINQVIDDISDDQYEIMATTSTVAASVVSIILQKQVNLLLIIRAFMDLYYENTLPLKSDFSFNNSYVNSYKLAQEQATNNT